MNPRHPSPPLTFGLVASGSGRHTRSSARQPAIPDPQVVDITVRADDLLLLTVDDAARRLCIGRSLLYELIAAGEIHSIRVGRLRRIPVSALTDYVNRQAPEPDSAA